jgi:hypothetical protein
MDEEGAVATAIEDWKAKFQHSLTDPKHPHRCPPYRFNSEDGPLLYAFWFYKGGTEDCHREVCFVIDKVRATYEVSSTLAGARPWELAVVLNYQEKGQPFKFAPNLKMIHQAFAALNASGDYACVGSSAVRLHSSQLERISSVDVVVPDEGPQRNDFLVSMRKHLSDKWVQLTKRSERQHSGSQSVGSFITTDGRRSLNINTVGRIGSWRFDSEAIARTRQVSCGAIVARFLSLEDAIATYVSLDSDRRRYSAHNLVVREFVRALCVDGEQLRRDALERILDRMEFNLAQAGLVRGFCDRLTAACTDFSQKYPALAREGFADAWSCFQKQNLVGNFPLDQWMSPPADENRRC